MTYYDHEQLLSDQAESQQWQREQLAKELGREPTEEEFEADYEAWLQTESAAHRAEYERMKRWAEPKPEDGRDDPKTFLRNQLLPKDRP